MDRGKNSWKDNANGMRYFHWKHTCDGYWS